MAAFVKEALKADKGYGRVEAMDALARKFTAAAAAADRAAVLKEAEAAAGGVEDGEAKASAAMYVSYMKKAIEKGGNYIGDEKARLDKVRSGTELELEQKQARRLHQLTTAQAGYCFAVVGHMKLITIAI